MDPSLRPPSGKRTGIANATRTVVQQASSTPPHWRGLKTILLIERLMECGRRVVGFRYGRVHNKLSTARDRSLGDAGQSRPPARPGTTRCQAPGVPPRTVLLGSYASV